MSKAINMNRAFMASAVTQKPQWRVFDAAGKIVGRLASDIAIALRGKDCPEFTPHANMNKYIIVVNAEKVIFTGNKMTHKEYESYSGYIGGLKKKTPMELLTKSNGMHAGDIITHAVMGMLPKNKLSRQLSRQIKVYKGPHHPHKAQMAAGIAPEETSAE